MGRAEALEARMGELEGELRELLDEYVEVQQRIQTLEAATGHDGDRAGEAVVADLPDRLRRVARAAESTGTGDFDDGTESDAAGDCASQAEVAAAVERVEESAPDEGAEASDGTAPPTDDSPAGGESTPEGNDEEDLGDIIVG